LRIRITISIPAFKLINIAGRPTKAIQDMNEKHPASEDRDAPDKVSSTTTANIATKGSKGRSAVVTEQQHATEPIKPSEMQKAIKYVILHGASDSTDAVNHINHWQKGETQKSRDNYKNLLQYLRNK